MLKVFSKRKAIGNIHSQNRQENVRTLFRQGNRSPIHYFVYPKAYKNTNYKIKIDEWCNAFNKGVDEDSQDENKESEEESEDEEEGEEGELGSRQKIMNYLIVDTSSSNSNYSDGYQEYQNQLIQFYSYNKGCMQSV